MFKRKKKNEDQDAGLPMKKVPTAKDAKKVRADQQAYDEDFDYMNDVAAAILEQTPRRARMILWFALLFLAIAIFWANIAEVDEITRGEGKVIPSSRLQVVQNLEGGIVSEILVKEGDVVEEGQVLIKIDDTRFASSFQEQKLQRFSLLAKSARLRAEADGSKFKATDEVLAEHPEIVDQEKELYDSRKLELDSNKRILKDQVAQRYQELVETRTKKGQIERSHDLLAEELRRTKPLLAEGAISEVEVLRLERQVNDLRGELEVTSHAITRMQSKYNEAKRKLEEAEISFRNEARRELNEVLRELAQIKESSGALEDRVKRTAVRSPVVGKVKQVLVTTVGGVVQPGMDLIEIVPLKDNLQVEARIKPTDIAFLRPGLKATVKFTAYDFAIYGGLDANIVHIGADSITDDRGEAYYIVRVQTEKNFLGDDRTPLPIIPGMVATVDILTGKKSILDYLLKPILKAKERALRER